MMENALSSKMREFMTVLDQVKRYRAMLSSLTDFAIILAITFVSVMFLVLFAPLTSVFSVNNFPPNSAVYSILGSITLPIFGLALGIFWVARKVHAVKVGQWKGTLEEGAPGAIKLLQEINWDNVFTQIRYAKLGFGLYGLARTCALWTVAFLVTWYAGGYIISVLHWNLNIAIVILFSLALSLFLSKNDLQRKYEQIGRLDALLWELRWFDNEFRRTDFKA
jgi:hypothetical protein